MKRSIAAALAVGLVASAASAEQVLREIAWGPLERQGVLSVGEVRPADKETPFEHLVVTSGPEPRTIKLLTLVSPGITQPRYALSGQIRYEGVEGKGYLEMWNEIPGKGSFFTRTLGAGGNMGSLEGSSGWRPVLLPFDATGAPSPTTLTVNLALPGRGTVQLGPLRLVQYTASEDAARTPGAWWSPRTAGLVGGIAGSLIGCMGAVIGLLAQKGRGRSLALTFVKGMMAVGAVSLAFGVVAVLRSQPYEVFYPLLLMGALCSFLPLLLLPVIRRRYEDLELRKMTAQDVGTRSAGHFS